MSHSMLRVFDRICIINLPERADRRRAVSAELRRLGWAVDGHHIRFSPAHRPASRGAFPSIGARGCYISHLQVLRQAQADGVRRLLVLEDDVMFGTALQQAEVLLPALQGDSWRLAYLGHIQPAMPGPLRWVISHEALQCAHCYAVHAEALPDLIDYLESCMARPPGHPLGGPMHVDGALSMLRAARPDLLTLRSSRSLAGQRSSRSDIIGPSWLDKLPFAALLRSCRNEWRRIAGQV